MFNIDIASLRDPATLTSVKAQISAAAAIVSAFQDGCTDAEECEIFQRSLNHLMNELHHQGIKATGDLHHSLVEAYNLGWDTVRLQRGVNKNAK